MSEPSEIAAALVRKILAAPRRGRRRLVAIAGPPASGKSTLADDLAQQLTGAGCLATVVPMDGFHLDNRVLSARGILHRKGAPDSFDVGGLFRLIGALADGDEVVYPTFDRAKDLAIAGSGIVGPDCDTLIVEGNYLLYDAPGWRDFHDSWDFSVRLDVPSGTLERRLIDRWLAQGHTLEMARVRARQNDLANAALVAERPLPADVTVRSDA